MSGSAGDPREPGTLNLAELYQAAVSRQSQGDLDGAIELYETILQRKPDAMEVMCNLGGALHAKGRLAEAIHHYQQALSIKPELAPLHYNLAGAHQALGQTEQARASYNRVIALQPDSLEAQFGLAMLDVQTGLYSAALQSFRQILSIRPDLPDVNNAAGLCHSKLGDPSQALACFQRALDLDPNHFEALGNLAAALMSRCDFAGAIEANKRALTLKPGDTKVLFNLGVAEKQVRRFEDAANRFRNILAIDPSARYAQLELAHTLQTVCDWRDERYSLQSTADLIQTVLDVDDDTDIDVFNALSLPLTNRMLQRVAERKSHRIRQLSTQAWAPLALEQYRNPGRLRVGYLSPDFRNHPAAHLMGGLFNAHDRDSFEVFAYSIGPDDGSIYRRRTEADAEHFVDLYAASLEQCIARIRSDRIHILVDLAGYATGARPGIIAARSAPVQVNYLGFPGTLGADFFDYLVTDPIITPAAFQTCYAEKFAYLPHCYQINDDRNQAAASVPTRSECGLPGQAFVFCCFNNNYKIDATIFRTWCSILSQVPDSVLWLLKGSELQTHNLRREAAAHGVDPARILFAPPVDKAAHLARHAHADLFLDTLNYNAHTTGSDALTQAVPMITCRGDTFASRVGASLLHAVGLDELVATDLDQYAGMAVQLATDQHRLDAVRNTLANNLPLTSLLDNPRFASSLEHLYRIMWQRISSGRPPAQIDPPDAAGT